MELTALYQRVIGLDVHQAKITACAIVEHNDGEIEIIEREFGAFKRDRRALAEWARELAPERVVMESTGTYWKSPYAALEKVGIHAMVVNARHAKGVPGRKTDIADARWLATLARAGLLRGSFVPPAQMRQLRLVSRQRQKLVGQCSAEKNRLHKILTDAGIRLNVVVSDIHGQAARAMIKSLIDGRPLHEVLDRKGRLRASREELLEALNTDEFSAVHRFVAAEILEHIEQLEQRIARMDRYLLDALKDHGPLLDLLETIAQGLQEGHRRPGPQDAAHHLRHAQQRDSLQGQHRRLRGTDRSPECAALAEDAAQARIYYRRRYGVILLCHIMSCVRGAMWLSLTHCFIKVFCDDLAKFPLPPWKRPFSGSQITSTLILSHFRNFCHLAPAASVAHSTAISVDYSRHLVGACYA